MLCALFQTHVSQQNVRAGPQASFSDSCGRARRARVYNVGDKACSRMRMHIPLHISQSASSARTLGDGSMLCATKLQCVRPRPAGGLTPISSALVPTLLHAAVMPFICLSPVAAASAARSCDAHKCCASMCYQLWPSGISRPGNMLFACKAVRFVWRREPRWLW